MHRVALCLLAGTIAVVPASCGDDDGEPAPGTTATAPRPGIVLDLSTDTAAPGDKLRLTIENTTRTRFEFGVAYRLERRTDDRWRWINRDSAFILILKFVEPGGREREEIRLPPDLKPGRYRIVKGFSAGEREIEASVEFSVR